MDEVQSKKGPKYQRYYQSPKGVDYARGPINF